MDTSNLLAKIIGPYFVVIGAGILTNRRLWSQIIEDFFSHPALRMLGGGVKLAIGLLVVAFHNEWYLHWGLILTILGWLMVLLGAMVIISPGIMASLAGAYKRHTTLVIIHACVVLALGVLLTLIGFWPHSTAL